MGIRITWFFFCVCSFSCYFVFSPSRLLGMKRFRWDRKLTQHSYWFRTEFVLFVISDIRQLFWFIDFLVFAIEKISSTKIEWTKSKMLNKCQSKRSGCGCRCVFVSIDWHFFSLLLSSLATILANSTLSDWGLLPYGNIKFESLKKKSKRCYCCCCCCSYTKYNYKLKGVCKIFWIKTKCTIQQMTFRVTPRINVCFLVLVSWMCIILC